jgi:hypothetical protein
MLVNLFVLLLATLVLVRDSFPDAPESSSYNDYASDDNQGPTEDSETFGLFFFLIF